VPSKIFFQARYRSLIKMATNQVTPAASDDSEDVDDDVLGRSVLTTPASDDSEDVDDAVLGRSVFIWGRSSDEEAGEDEPIEMDLLDRDCDCGIKLICLGNSDAYVVTVNGDMKRWGPSGKWNAVRHEDRTVAPMDEPILRNISYMDSGDSTYAAIAENGDLFTWGDGGGGKLGHGDEEFHEKPKRVEALAGTIKMKKVVCGTNQTIALAASGEVYGWGSNEDGAEATGHFVTEGSILSPKLIEELSNKQIVDISAYDAHTIALSEDGRLFTWGDGRNGNLGHGDKEHVVVPKLVEGLIGKHVVYASAGVDHTGAVTEDGEIYIWGSNDVGQLGLGRMVPGETVPTLVTSESVRGVFFSKVFCGQNVSYALTKNGELYSWGSNDSGKLGHREQADVFKPRKVKGLKSCRVLDMILFDDHAAALVDKKSLPVDNLVPMTSAFSVAVNEGDFSDVTFLVEGIHICAHRVILTNRCKYFAKIFRSSKKEAKEDSIISISDDVRHHIFLLFLQYLYTDQIKVELDDAVELYFLANVYGLPTLRDKCFDSVQRLLTIEKLGRVLCMSSEKDCEELRIFCLDFARKNFALVSETEGIKEVGFDLLLEIVRGRKLS